VQKARNQTKAATTIAECCTNKKRSWQRPNNKSDFDQAIFEGRPDERPGGAPSVGATDFPNLRATCSGDELRP